MEAQVGGPVASVYLASTPGSLVPMHAVDPRRIAGAVAFIIAGIATAALALAPQLAGARWTSLVAAGSLVTLALGLAMLPGPSARPKLRSGVYLVAGIIFAGALA